MAVFVALLAFLTVMGITMVAARGAQRRLAMGGGGFSDGRIAAHGLVVSADRYSTERRVNGQMFEIRSMVLDVEIPGQAPYEVSVNPLIPRICEALPGSALDLRVHPRNQSDVIIVGPSGSSGWVMAAAATNAPGMTGNRSGLYAIGFVAAVFVSLFAFGFTKGAVEASEASSPHSSKSSSHSPVGSGPRPSCEGAARCCKVLGSDCSAFSTMSEPVCAKVLSAERVTASKVGKRCP